MYEFEREFQAILSNLDKIGALKHLVLIGSWVLPIFAYHYKMPLAAFTTSDIDFSVIRPHDRAIKSNPSVHIRLGKNSKLKMFKDLDTAKIVAGFIGTEPVLKAASFYRGKFVMLFEKGWKAYMKRFSDQVV